MAEKHTFPVPGCSSCPDYEVVGGITRYCSGFKRRKARRFRKSDPKIKAPRWCPRRISPPACRVYGFKDEDSEYMDMLQRNEYEMGRLKAISPLTTRYKFRTEIPLRKTAKQFFDETQQEPLRDILPESVSSGEIIEIDDGLQPYYFYVLNYGTVIPLSYFRLPK